MSTLHELAALRLEAKAAEDAAVAKRRALDEQIAMLLQDPNKPEGTVTEKPDGFKVSVTYGMNRKVDTAALQVAWNTLPKPVQDAVRWKAEVSVTGMRALDQGESLILSKFVTASPASPQVKVEAV